MTRPLRETDLFEPIRDHLVAAGYTVRAEVDDCDVAAYRDGELLIVELKRQLSVDLLIQAVKRQSITRSVYVAIPGPLDMGRRSRWKGLRRLLRRLELGLLVVRPGGRGGMRVDPVLHPQPYRHRFLKARRLRILEEMIGRSGNRNRGGSTGSKLVTAYRENAIQIAAYLRRLGPSSPRDLRDLGGGSKTQSILYDNVYGWFRRVGRGIYALSDRGHRELADYEDLAVDYGEDVAHPPG